MINLWLSSVSASKRRFLVPETEQLADFLGADGLAGLPTPDEVGRAFPDRHGYGTGQEDAMIHAGAMLDALAARAEAAERGAAPSLRTGQAEERADLR